MAVTAHVALPGVVRKQYNQVRAEVGWLEEPPACGSSHLTGWEDGVWRNVGAWESERANSVQQIRHGTPRFGMAKAGVQAEMQVTFDPAHEVYAPRAAEITG